MPKNILIFSDGTGQAGGLRPDQTLSNVYKLFRATRVNPENDIDPARQVAFYDAGLGTENDEGRIPIRPIQFYRKALSSATGTGISRNIADCYEAIIKHYEPGDRVYLFGFSRGAYTARCVGGVTGMCGIPTRMPDGGPVPRFGAALRKIADEAVREVYSHGSGKPTDSRYADERKEKARRFREKYGSGNAQGEANEVPYFIGVFDTVAALGAEGPFRMLLIAVLVAILVGLAAVVALVLALIPAFSFFGTATTIAALFIGCAAWVYWSQNFKSIKDFPKKGDYSWHFVSWRLRFYNTFLNKRVMFARHALAIGENRKNFPRVPWDVEGELVRHAQGMPEWMVQMWFAGNHSDIGGSYPEEESRLSDIALGWMLDEATSLPAPILVDRSKLRLFPSPAGLQHCQICAMRDAYPSWVPQAWRRVWPVQIREIHAEAVLHPSVDERFQLPSVLFYGVPERYRPENLQRHVRLGRHFAAPVGDGWGDPQ